MPFRSEKQRRYLWAKEPAIAKKWTKEHGSKVVKKNSTLKLQDRQLIWRNTREAEKLRKRKVVQ